jgi:hypothetical protein
VLFLLDRNMSEAAEAALRATLGARGDDVQEIDDAVAAVRGDPNRYRDRQCARGDLARCILERAERRIVTFDPAPAQVTPIIPRREPSVVEVDVAQLSEHKYFKPMGPKVFAQAPVNHAFSHRKRSRPAPFPIPP